MLPLKLTVRATCYRTLNGSDGMLSSTLSLWATNGLLESTPSMDEVAAAVGELRHGLSTLGFAKPIRMVFGNQLVGKRIRLECTLFGKQLRKPRTEVLTIRVLDPVPAISPRPPESETIRNFLHNGIFPCFFGGFVSRLFSSTASARMSLGRV
jgi:hypothetical protein